MLVGSGNCSSSEECGKLISEILSPLSLSIRETDVLGWYKKDVVVGVIFTEISIQDKALIGEVMLARITEVLRSRLKVEQLGQITLSFHVFPCIHCGCYWSLSLYSLSESNAGGKSSRLE